MFHAFDFLRYSGHDGIYWIILIAVFLAIFIFEKNPKPQEEKHEEEYAEEEQKEEEYKDEMEEK